VRLDSRDYFCLFYRDVYPAGWNIANGTSDTIEEMLDPESIIVREFAEELLISDDTRKLIYAFDAEGDKLTRGTRTEALKAWQARFPDRDLSQYQRLGIPLKWIDGPDQVCVRYGDRQHRSSGYFLSITPRDSAIEVDRIVLINLKDDVAFFDGEILRGALINSPIGLFPADGFEARLGSREFRPELLFFGAARRGPEELERIIAKEYLPAVAHLRSRAELQAYRQERHPFDLCPITRSIIGRYCAWSKTEAERTRISRRKVPASSAQDYQVFISYKSEDAQIAQWVYEHLKNDYSVFCSVRSLARLGESDYASAIDAALESASCLILIGTRPENFDSAWVGYEWKSFLNEIRSGRKPQGHLFTFAGGVTVDQLPYALRSMQMIPYSAASPHDSLAQLSEFVIQAISAGQAKPAVAGR
jgi:hypothetical protein